MKGSDIVYISIDMERSGDWLKRHFVTEIGMVAYDAQGTEIASIQVYLAQEDGKAWDPETLEWYKEQPGWSKWQTDAIAVPDAMKQIQTWIKKTRRLIKAQKHAFVCAPTSADGKWFSYLWFEYIGHPLGGPRYGPGFTYIDIRSYAAGKLGIDIFESKKNKALARFRPPKDMFPHTHIAIDDAREQGALFFNIKHYKPNDNDNEQEEEEDE